VRLGYVASILVDCLSANPPYGFTFSQFNQEGRAVSRQQTAMAEVSPDRKKINPPQNKKPSPGKVQPRLGYVASICWIA